MESSKLNPAIGHVIAQARASLGLTQREFAQRLGVSQGLVGAWESHRKPPGQRALKKISDETGLSMDAIAKGGDIPPRTLTLTDAGEIELITLYRRLPSVAKKNARELIEMATNIGRIQQKKRAPLKAE